MAGQLCLSLIDLGGISDCFCDYHICYNYSMIREIAAYAVVILSFYILLSYLNSPSAEPERTSPYHMGCYEASSTFNHSKVMSGYLQNLS